MKLWIRKTNLEVDQEEVRGDMAIAVLLDTVIVYQVFTLCLIIHPSSFHVNTELFLDSFAVELAMSADI